MKPIRVAWYSRSCSPNIASFRIRCLNLLKPINGFGVNASVFKNKNMYMYDIVVMMKAYHESDFLLATELKNNGVMIVFDICDNHFMLGAWYVNQLKKMINLSDLCTVTTLGMARLVKQYVGDSQEVCVIPDAREDIFPAREYPWVNHPILSFRLYQLNKFLKLQRGNGATKLVWFGNHQGSFKDSGMLHLKNVLPIIDKVHLKNPLSLTVISNSKKKYKKLIESAIVPTCYLEWNPSTFGVALSKHDISVIPIVKNDFTKVKGNNRVVTSFLHGLNVVANSIESYEVFKECVALDDWEGGLLGYIKSPARSKEHCEAALKIINENYSLSLVAQQWVVVLSEAYEKFTSH